MKSFLIKSTLVLILVLITLSFTDSIFNKKTQGSYTKEVYKKVKGNIEIAFFGSSHAFSTYNPKVFDSITGMTSFNFGSTAQRLITTEPVIKMVLRNEKLKLAVVDIFSMSLDTIISNQNSKNLQYETLDNIDMSWSKIKAFNSIYGFENMHNIFTTIRNHSIWKDSKVFTMNKEYYFNGFNTSNTTFNNTTWDNFIAKQKRLNKKNKKSLGVNKLADREKNLIDQIVNEFRGQNIPVIFCSAPSYNEQINFQYSLYQELIAKYLNKIDIPFLDYNNYWQELSLSKDDFKDPNHLNYRGALKVSTHFSEIIKNNISSDFNFNQIKFKERRKNSFSQVVLKTGAKHDLSKDITIDNYKLVKYKFGLELKIGFDSLNIKQHLNKYRLGIHMYPKENSKKLISVRSKKKGLSFDIFNVLLEKVKNNNISLQINTQIKEFDRIKLFLYNKEKYNGIIGRPVWIKDL